MLRITTASTFQTGVENLQRRQREMTQAQEQLTSGKRVQRASDDPTAAGRAERALAVISRSDANQRALEASRNAMTLTEGALADAADLMQQAREALMAAGNASYSDAERLGVAQKLAGIRSQLLAVSNRSDGAGGYLFAGQGSGQSPFVDAAGGVQYRGTGGEVVVASEESLPVTVDGGLAWLQARTGNSVFETRSVSASGAWIDSGRVTDPSALTGSTYTVTFTPGAGGMTFSVQQDGNPTVLTDVPFVSGRAIDIDGMSFNISGTPLATDSFEIVPSTPTLSVFNVFDQAIEELSTPLRTGAAVTQTVQRALRDVDASSLSLQALRSAVGENLSRADSVEGRVESLKFFGESERSAAEDLDMVKAISDFQARQTGYDAALQTYTIVQRMSLFEYLR